MPSWENTLFGITVTREPGLLLIRRVFLKFTEAFLHDVRNFPPYSLNGFLSRSITIKVTNYKVKKNIGVVNRVSPGSLFTPVVKILVVVARPRCYDASSPLP